MIYKGTKELENLYLGNKELEAVYLGNKEVWTNCKLINLGSGQTFNIQPYLKYEHALDNFYIRTFPSFTASDTGQYAGYPVPSNATYNYQKSISGNTLTFRGYREQSNGGGGYYNLNPFLLTKNAKAISLGNGTSFNIRTKLPNVDYTQLTADDFYFRVPVTENAFVWNDEPGDRKSVWAKGTFYKSYNASNGVLTMYITTDHYPWGDETNRALSAWYIPRKYLR